VSLIEREQRACNVAATTYKAHMALIGEAVNLYRPNRFAHRDTKAHLFKDAVEAIHVQQEAKLATLG
jgi:hypothetical protein